MHIFFSGIGGTGIGPLALIAKQAGYEVSGSDKQESQYIEYLKKHGITEIHVGQTAEAIAKVHARHPIDWFVYSSALPKENPNHPELLFADEQGIKHTKRDEFLNAILAERKTKLIAIAGTHGKTTTTAMVIWLFKELDLPLSYSVGGKISFGDMGHFDPASEYFAYECDEFDRNFLAFNPHISLITGVTWDHHEIFPTREAYQEAFHDFINQSDTTVLWQDEFDYLSLGSNDSYIVLDDDEPKIHDIAIPGIYRRDAWLALQGVHQLTKEPIDKLIEIVSRFPGTGRRFETIVKNLITDYAHTPEKIVGALSIAAEMAEKTGQKVVVVYEPLTNRRMHYMKEQHSDVFQGASKIYWVPSYLAREDPSQEVLSPAELIPYLSPDLQVIASPMELNDQLKSAIQKHLDEGDLVLCLSGGGGNSFDEWLRKEFKA